MKDFTDISKVKNEESTVKPEDIIIFDRNLQKTETKQKVTKSA